MPSVVDFDGGEAIDFVVGADSNAAEIAIAVDFERV